MIIYNNHQLTPQNARFLKSLGYKLFSYKRKDGRYFGRYKATNIRRIYR